MTLYITAVITSFKHKALRQFFESGDRARLPAEMIERISRVLAALDAAKSLDDISAVQSFRLHRLRGELESHWAVTVRANWRIVFRVSGENIEDVDFMDYH